MNNSHASSPYSWGLWYHFFGVYSASQQVQVHASSIQMYSVSLLSRSPSQTGFCAAPCWSLGVCAVPRSSQLLLALFQFLDVMAELEGRAQLQPHVLHNHVASQQHQSFAIDLLEQ